MPSEASAMSLTQSKGFPPPRYTQVPDEILDGMGERPYPETLVLLYIARRTFGFGQATAVISYGQFLNGTVLDGEVQDTGCGIRSRTTLSAAIQSLKQQGMIIVERAITPFGAPGSTSYHLHGAESRAPVSPDDVRANRSATYRKLVAMFGDQCARCASPGPLIEDHVIPKSFGGTDHIQNRQLLCTPCNEEKGIQDTDYREIP